MRNSLAALYGTLLVLSTSVANAAGLQGDYVEARTADVFTGPCISNAEVFISGSEAVMAWKIKQGSWKGTDLSGLCVAAAVRGTTTFSEDQPDKAAAVLIVDQKASPLQREALLAGRDSIELTLAREPEISEFQRRDRELRPWVYELAGDT